MPASPPGDPDREQDRELRPAGRYEWEQIVRRARLKGVITGSARIGKDGRSTRGGVDAVTVKAIALALASYGSDKGADVFPGDATIAVDLEISLKTVKAVKAKLIGLGLLEHVGWRRRSAVYQLAIPSDLLELLEVLTPAQHTLEAERVSAEAHGRVPRSQRLGGTGGPPEEAPDGGSAGTPDAGSSECPPVPPSPAEVEDVGGSAGPPPEDVGGSAGPASGGPPDPGTDQDRTISMTKPTDEDLGTNLAVVAREAGQDQIQGEVGGQERPPLTVVPTPAALAGRRRPQPPSRGFWPAPVPEPEPTSASLPMHPDAGRDPGLPDRSRRGAAACRAALGTAGETEAAAS